MIAISTAKKLGRSTSLRILLIVVVLRHYRRYSTLRKIYRIIASPVRINRLEQVVDRGLSFTLGINKHIYFSVKLQITVEVLTLGKFK